MADWTGLALALSVFVATHFVPTRPSLRGRLIATFGRRAWFSIYGLVSLGVTAWVIMAGGKAPCVEIWPQLPCIRWVPDVVMPLAILLAVLGLPARTATLSAGPPIFITSP